MIWCSRDVPPSRSESGGILWPRWLLQHRGRERSCCSSRLGCCLTIHQRSCIYRVSAWSAWDLPCIHSAQSVCAITKTILLLSLDSKLLLPLILRYSSSNATVGATTVVLLLPLLLLTWAAAAVGSATTAALVLLIIRRSSSQTLAAAATNKASYCPRPIFSLYVQLFTRVIRCLQQLPKSAAIYRRTWRVLPLSLARVRCLVNQRLRLYAPPSFLQVQRWCLLLHPFGSLLARRPRRCHMKWRRWITLSTTNISIPLLRLRQLR